MGIASRLGRRARAAGTTRQDGRDVFLAALALAFGVVLLVELPDKTLVATLVLSTRYRPRAGARRGRLGVRGAVRDRRRGRRADHLLPQRAVEAVVAVLFASARSCCSASRFQPADDEVELADHREALPFWRVVADRRSACCSRPSGATPARSRPLGWSPASAAFAHAVATGVGAWVALVLVAAALAVVLGRVVLPRVPLHLVHRVAGALFAVFAVLAACAAIAGCICAAESAVDAGQSVHIVRQSAA